jgi:hypothetical protein
MLATLRARALAALLAAAALGAAAPAAAQSLNLGASYLRPDYKAVTLTVDVREPLFEDPLGAGGSVDDVTVSDWLLGVRVGGGATFSDGEVEPTAVAQVGIVRRLPGASIGPRVGLWGYATSEPGAIGPLLRVEAQNLGGVQAGWLFFDGGGEGFTVGLDVSTGLLCDLFFCN